MGDKYIVNQACNHPSREQKLEDIDKKISDSYAVIKKNVDELKQLLKKLHMLDNAHKKQKRSNNPEKIINSATKRITVMRDQSKEKSNIIEQELLLISEVKQKLINKFDEEKKKLIEITKNYLINIQPDFSGVNKNLINFSYLERFKLSTSINKEVTDSLSINEIHYNQLVFIIIDNIKQISIENTGIDIKNILVDRLEESLLESSREIIKEVFVQKFYLDGKIPDVECDNLYGLMKESIFEESARILSAHVYKVIISNAGTLARMHNLMAIIKGFSSARLREQTEEFALIQKKKFLEKCDSLLCQLNNIDQDRFSISAPTVINVLELLEKMHEKIEFNYRKSEKGLNTLLMNETKFIDLLQTAANSDANFDLSEFMNKLDDLRVKNMVELFGNDREVKIRPIPLAGQPDNFSLKNIKD